MVAQVKQQQKSVKENVHTLNSIEVLLYIKVCENSIVHFSKHAILGLRRIKITANDSKAYFSKNKVKRRSKTVMKTVTKLPVRPICEEQKT